MINLRASEKSSRSGRSYKRALIHLLDRPFGRYLLGKIATTFIGRRTGADVEVGYMDGLWTHRVGSNFFPDRLRFEYTEAEFSSWKGQPERYASDTNEYWLRYYRPQEGDVIIDVGAGRGEDTLTFSRGVGKTGRVIAIEAHPLSFTILKSFCLLNGLTNVTALRLALMDKAGFVRIVESESSWMENAIEFGESSRGNEVRSATLADIWVQEGLKEISFLKMNIEGAERFALLGMESVLPHIRQICVACHDFRSDLGHGEQFRTRLFVENMLTKYGFTLALRRDDPRDYVRDHVFGLRRS